MNQTATTSSRWLYSPFTDTMLGCGGAYAIFFIILMFAGTTIHSYFPYAMTPLVALFLSIPHYGATLLRVYESPESRRKYQFFSVFLTAVVWTFFGVGVYDNFVGSLLITIYLMWSPWHYMGQNYGVALMFLARRGMFVTPFIKRWLHVSFLASYALTLIGMQTLPSSYPITGYGLYRIGLSNIVRDICYLIFGGIYLISTIGSIYQLLRRGKFSDISPTLMLIGTQALWFLVPDFAMYFQVMQGAVPLSAEYAVYAFFWVAMGHAVQYLWITSYFANRSAETTTPPLFWSKALIAGALIWVIPALLFAPGVFGRLSYGGGLALLVGAAVNLHHFILDGAIWKLRDGPIARILLRPVDTKTMSLQKVTPFMRWLIVGVGIFCVAINYSATLAALGFDHATLRGDVSQVVKFNDRLKWTGRDSAENQLVVAKLLLKQNETMLAKEYLKNAEQLAHAAGDETIENKIAEMLAQIEKIGMD